MNDEVQLRLIRRGIQSTGSEIVLETLTTLPSVLGLSGQPLLTWSSSHSVGGHQTSPSHEDCSDLYNLSGLAL